MKIIFKKDTASRSVSFRAKNKFYFINKKIKDKLIKLSCNEKISRFCLNMNKNDKLNQMLIFQKKGYVSEIKKNYKKDKSYINISGEQIIKIYNKSGKAISKNFLNKKNFIFWIPRNTWHNNQTISKNSFHIESISGPFKRKADRKYLNKK